MTPTSLAYDALEPDDVCLVGTSGEQLGGRSAPTSELPLHTLVYARRPEVGAIVHTHSPGGHDARRARVAAAADPHRPRRGGRRRRPRRAVRAPGHGRDGRRRAAALVDRGACLLRHHGLLAVGADLARAFRAASVTEHAAKVYLDARAQGAEVPELDPGDVAWIARSWLAQWA